MLSISWRSFLYWITFGLFAVSITLWILTTIGWLITEPGFEPLNVLFGAVISSLLGVLALLQARKAQHIPINETLKYSPTAEQQARNRRAMLELVRKYWVQDVLENSLHQAVLIQLGMKEKVDAVDYHPWDMIWQTPHQSDRTLSPGTKMIDVFDQKGQALLILGAPGSGKTTMLLALTKDLIAQAEQDLTQPIPVVFKLSSWTNSKQPIAEWLVSELGSKYNIPKRIAGPWVEHDELLLLLDGLDEVAEEREACVKAINDFRQEHLTPVVICSRVTEYETLTTRLKLQGAVVLQPLTPQQVDDYLSRIGPEFAAIRVALQDDPSLPELVELPLMLDVMILAYQGMSIQTLRSIKLTESRQKYLFSAYVKQMFKRRGIEPLYSQKETLYWLAWLAKKMSEHEQTMFLIEQMQSSLLPSGQVWIFKWGFWLLLGLVIGLIAGPSRVLLIGLIFMLLLGLIVEPRINPVEKLKWSWGGTGQILSSILGCGLVSGLFFGVVDGLFSGLVGVVVGLVSGMFFGLITGLNYEDIETKAIPNQGIWQSVKNAVIGGLLAGVSLGLPLGLIMGLLFGRIDGLLVGLRVGLFIWMFFWLFFGLIGGLIFGGYASLQHLTLRILLYRDGHIPWNYARFLDYCARLIFLRKVGGGYIFIHRLIQEYFASLEPKRLEKG